MANYCLNLNAFKTSVFHETSWMLLKTHLKRFLQLKRLDIRLITVDKWMTIKELFDDFQSLTHLWLALCQNIATETDFIKDIDKYLPNLQSLEIEGRIKATEETADSLSRLSRLVLLRLRVENVSIINIIKTKVKKNCRKIKSIIVYSCLKCLKKKI